MTARGHKPRRLRHSPTPYIPHVEELGPGLYERLLTEGLKAQLDELGESFRSERRGLRAIEAPDRIAWHLSRQIERALADVGDEDRVTVGLAVARALLHRLGELVEVDPSVVPTEPLTVLHAILSRRRMAHRQRSPSR